MKFALAIVLSLIVSVGIVYFLWRMNWMRPFMLWFFLPFVALGNLLNVIEGRWWDIGFVLLFVAVWVNTYLHKDMLRKTKSFRDIFKTWT